MESWRERGFVPDSDEEDGFDSLDAKKLNAKEEKEQEEEGGGGNELGDSELTSTAEGDATQDSPEDEDKNEESFHDNDSVDELQDDTTDRTTGKEDPPASTGSTKDNTEDEETDSQTTPIARKKKRSNSPSPNTRAAPDTSPFSTPRAKLPQDDMWDVPSSSPDELQMDFHPARKPVSLPARQVPIKQPQPNHDVVDDSPLSSPPSSVRSLRLDEGQGEQAEAEGRQEKTPGEQLENRLENDLENLLPPLDIPEDVLQELSRPERRSLRQRNPIQLHPYLLEDAKYQSLMKARGVKPVRIAQYQQALREAAARNDENQDQSFENNAEPPLSSPVGEFVPPPSSPAELQPISERQSRKSTSGRERPRNLQPHARSPRAQSPRAAKRRKVSQTDWDHLRQQEPSPRPRVVIDNGTTSRRLESNSIFDIPPSPPRSGSVSSTYTTQNQSGFRFPRGFTPPPLSTPVTESRLNSRDVEGDGAMDLSAPDADDRSVGAESVSSHSQQNSDVEDDQNQERAVRAMQRKIKGVLPASWLRLDQQKQKEGRLSSTQLNRDRASAHRPDNAKGVAKKVIRRSGSTGILNPRAQLTSLSHLADDDGDDESDGNAPSATEDSHLTLAEVVGFKPPHYNQDIGDDIPEDNRIDNMFPPIPRSPSSSRSRKHGTKRLRPEKGGMHTGNQHKRPRLKRQTRLTDSVASGRRIDGRRTRKPRARVPPLGILDAPDVVQRPRQEQPQFLRVAARQALSRRDRGRRSPTRKFFDLGSRNDTDDANISLNDWRKGKIRQTQLTLPQRKPQRRPPLVDLTTNRREVPEGRNAREARQNNADSIGAATQPERIASAPKESTDSIMPIPTPTSNQKTTSSRRPAQFGMQGNKWVIRRNLAVSSLKRDTPRPAGLETETPISNTSPSLFHRSLSIINQDYRQNRASQTRRPNLTLDRFLSDSVSSARPRALQEVTAAENSTRLHESRSNAQVPPRRRHLKKRPPKRLDLDAIEQHQEPPAILSPDDPAPSVAEVDDPQADFGSEHRGLSSFQRSYTVDFNVAPLFTGTYFHESTFVGSGEFSRSLDVLSRDLDLDAGLFHLNVGSQSFRWGAWNDSVSSDLGFAFEKLVEGIETSESSMDSGSEGTLDQSCAIYRSIIKYTTETLSFLDPIDRAGFVTRVWDLVSNLNDHLATLISAANGGIGQISSYNLAFANLVSQIANNGLVNDAIAHESVDMVKATSRQAVAFFSSPSGLTDIRKCLNDQKLREKREVGIHDDYPAAEAYVVTRHVLRSSDQFKGWFEILVAEACLISDAGNLSNSKDVSSLESGWSGIFTTLPLNEVDQCGIARIGSRFKEAYDNWAVTQQLLRPVLDEYGPDLMPQPISYNSYCRTLFHRCFHLINGWGWRDCKPILDTLYDFFAKNTLYNLKQEESFGSPTFLDELDRNPSLEVRPGEPCFHTLLKIIGSGLRFMSRTYDKKKIRNFAWRLLPNHGRVYPKELPIRQEDLDALRNHHDLLCTLYFAVPDGCRPRLEAIKNLVHPGSSHRETCEISLRSWRRLIRFKLSTDEDTSGLDPFADWHSYFVTELLKQHSLARKEIEAQGHADSRFTKQMIESTISQNQRQIESLLNIAVNGLQNAVQLAPTLEHAQRVVAKLPVKAILGLFSSRVARVNTTVSEALHVVITYTQKCGPLFTPAAAPVATDEDSQEYGDWAAIEAMYGDEVAPTNEGVKHVEKVFHPAVSRLVSNCFGEDHSPEDKILLDVVECWSSIAQVLVSHKLRRWDNYLSLYDGDSWASLRSTVQTRKFTPQFLARCIEKDAGLISQCKPQVLGMWMSTLVERTSMLKFQHRLTEALLNEVPMDPLFENLPFSKDRTDGRYYITLEEFSQRRLSLISSLLSNMRQHLQDLEDTESSGLSIMKEAYRELIQQLMSSMKANYQGLGNSGQSVQGAYVDFVHRVVGFLQQYSREISPIDSFFMDPTSFPLPSTDPSYIVARLKSYEPKLSAEKVARTLIIFVQGVSERAAIDGQQVYLVDQLHASMADIYETGAPNRPTLRGILLQCVLPAYLENAFSNAAAWFLSLPILQAVSRTVRDLLFNMSTTDANCVSSVLGMISSIFQSSYQAFRFIVDDPAMLKSPAVLVTATAFVETITATLPILDYINRVTDDGKVAISQAQVFHSFALFAVFHLRGLTTLADELKENFANFAGRGKDTVSIMAPGFFHEARHAASRELYAYLSESWSRHQGKYYFTRRGGHHPQEVGVDPAIVAKLENSPEVRFEDTVGEFLRTCKGLDIFDNDRCN